MLLRDLGLPTYELGNPSRDLRGALHDIRGGALLALIGFAHNYARFRKFLLCVLQLLFKGADLIIPVFLFQLLMYDLVYLAEATDTVHWFSGYRAGIVLIEGKGDF